MAICECGLPKPLSACCLPIIQGKQSPATCEALMRARYTAYALGDESFLLRSWHPITRPLNLPLDTQAKWLSLTVLSSQGGSSDSEGTVEFIARYKVGGRAHR